MLTATLSPPRCSQRLNLLAILTIIVASLHYAFLPSVSATAINSSSDLQKCHEIKEDYDLRNLARDDNVLLVVHESGDDKSASRRHICNKLEATPKERIANASSGKGGRSTVFAFLEINEPSYDADGQLQDGGRNFARNSLGAKEYPAFLFVTGGMDGSSKYASHITPYVGEDVLDLAQVEKFIAKQTGFYLGNDVYNIVFFDSIATKFMSYGDASGIDRLKQKGLALIVRFSTLFSYREPFSSIGKLYNRAFALSLEKGMGYCGEQLKNMEKKIEANKNNVSPAKLHELQQKMAILRSFAEPRELNPEDERQIYIHVFLHIGLIVATLLLFILPSDMGGNDEEEAINAIPVIAKVVEDDDVKKHSKKTK